MENHQVMIDRIMLWVGRISLPVTTAMFASLAIVAGVSAATTGIQFTGTAGIVEIPATELVAMAIVWTIAALLLVYASTKFWQRKPLMN